MTAKAHIFMIETDPKLTAFLEAELKLEGYLCNTEKSGIAALDSISQHPFDLIMMNTTTQDMDSLTLCRRIREISSIPIIILSARDDVEIKVANLDAGADDYIVKPFNSKELFARLRVLLRRRNADPEKENFLRLQDIVLYLDRHEAVIGSQCFSLAKKEFELLAYLIRNKNIVLTRSRIIEEVWGYQFVGNTNVVDVYIQSLRSKLGLRNERNYISTIRGIGYIARG